MRWEDMTMAQKSELMGIYIKNGITNLDAMKEHYNKFAEGGSTDTPPSASGTTPETSDHTAVSQQYGYNLKGKPKDKSFIQKVAHVVNKFGDKPIKPEPQTKESWYKLLDYATKQMYKADAYRKFKNTYGYAYPLTPNNEQKQSYQSILDGLLNTGYTEYLDTYDKDKISRSQLAAKHAVAGSALSFLPFPQAKIAGAALSIPDQVFDIAAAIDEPKPSNVAHVGMDYLPYIGKLIPGKIDDVVFKALNIGGNVDDIASSYGYDIFDGLNKESIKGTWLPEVSITAKKKDGGPLRTYSVKSMRDSLYNTNPREEFLGAPAHGYDTAIPELWADMLGLLPDSRGHRPDVVKKPAHPSHPSRGTWNKEHPEYFELSDKGMENVNYTIFGLNDGSQDPQAVLSYQGGIVLPEITITPNGSYIYDPYDNIKMHLSTSKK